MKKLLGIFLAFLILSAFAFNSSAAPQTTLNFDLSCDGRNEVYKETGDIITVTFTLENATDKTAGYDISSLTNEIYYDHTFFEMVEGSTTVETDMELFTDIKIYSSGEHRVYFNGFAIPDKQYAAKQIVGTFQLKVIASEGESTIRSMGMVASGEHSYSTISEDLVVKIGDAPIDAVYEIAFETNGGTSVGSATVTYGEKITEPENPEKGEKYFVGWYKDAECTQKWDFESDIVFGDMTLYAKWSDTPAGDTDVIPDKPSDKLPDNNLTNTEDIENDYDWVWWVIIIVIVIILIAIII